VAGYSLTRSEARMLCTVLHLPIQPASALCAWLGVADTLQDDSLPAQDIASLTGKGYLSSERGGQTILPDLVRSLTLLAVNSTEIAMIIERNRHAALTRFAQVGKGLVQYGIDGQNLALFPVTDQESVAHHLIPEWFDVSLDDHTQVEMPLDAFLLFRQACTAADLVAGDSALETQAFEKVDLLEGFQRPTAQPGANGSHKATDARAVPHPSPEEHLRLLLALDFLQEIAPTTLEIGTAGKALASCLSDPDLCSLTVTLQPPGAAFPDTAVFLHGGDRLFFLEVLPEKSILRQFGRRQDALPWLDRLLIKGGQEYYVDFVIPSA
jgi:hypothetical protein